MQFELSRKRVAEAAEYVAGGVNSGFRLGIRPHPLVFESANGALLVDVDGNQFIDYFLGMGPMMLGHSPETVVAAAHRQLDRSLLVAGQTETEYEAAQLLVDLVPSAETIRFATSGSEAVQTAMRLARAATGRQAVIKFEGHYHGWLDNILWSVAPDIGLAGPRERPTPVAGSEGQMPTNDVRTLCWNDVTALEHALADHDVAAVIMEPVMFNNAGIEPLPGYLEAVRALCDATGTVLIFDEVITGFRVAAGGAQERFRVLPDLTILGKALANGFPVAALAGRRRYMDLIADQRVLHGGTYNSQSVSMAATAATLAEVASGRPHEHIAPVGQALMDGLADAFRAAGREAVIVGYPAVFNVRFGAADAVDYRSALGADRAAYADFALGLLHHGIRVLPRGTWFLSSAHELSHVDQTLAAVRSVLAEM